MKQSSSLVDRSLRCFALPAGTAQLAGDLTVETINGFTPAVGDSFVLMTATGGITGSFDNIVLPTPALGSDWDLVIDANEVRMELVDLVATVVGQGNQRSQITKIEISLEVDVDPDACTIIRRGVGGGTVGNTFAEPSTDVSGNTIVTIVFDANSAFTRGTQNALIDGNYQITIDPNKVRRAGTSVGMDGDADGLQGGEYNLGEAATNNFFAYYGDTRGVRAVGAFDFNQFRQTFGKLAGQPGYNEAFDYRGVNGVGAFEFNQFRQNFGKLLDWE